MKRVDGMLLDVTSNKNESVIELRSDKYQTEVFFRLTKAPQKGVDVKIEVDPAYLETYNAEHGTEFQLFPAADVAIDREGKLLLAPDEIRSVGVGVTLAAGSELQEGTTYLLPLKATSSTEGITPVSYTHLVSPRVSTMPCGFCSRAPISSIRATN